MLDEPSFRARQRLRASHDPQRAPGGGAARIIEADRAGNDLRHPNRFRRAVVDPAEEQRRDEAVHYSRPAQLDAITSLSRPHIEQVPNIR